MTETAPAGTRLPKSAELRPGVIGIPLPGVAMRIVSLEDPARAVATGETGEIAIRGPNVFAGYFEQPEATAAAFCDGWFLTGDIGRVDARGVFDLVDRRKNMIISGGFNVYPSDLEAVLRQHPGVADCAVIGIPSEQWGETPVGFYVATDDTDPADILAATNAQLGKTQRLSALHPIDELPRSAIGKVLKRELRDRLMESA